MQEYDKKAKEERVAWQQEYERRANEKQDAWRQDYDQAFILEFLGQFYIFGNTEHTVCLQIAIENVKCTVL